MKSLTSRVLGTENINWREARWLQNDNLKELDDEGLEKLATSLANNNFVMPFHVWEDPEGVIWILDGHHRQKALKHIEEHGVLKDGERVPIQLPDLLPATFVECENSQAAAKLVLIYSSAYAKITYEGLDDFLQMHELDFPEFSGEIDLPEFSMPRFEQKFDHAGGDEIGEEDEFEEEAPPKETPIKLGDVFRLGKHLLTCGSCFDKPVWENMLKDKKARAVFTDPPYNLPANFIGNKGTAKHKDFKMAKGEMSEEGFKDFLSSMMKMMREVTVDGSIHYICMDFRHIWHMCEAGKEAYGSMIPKQVCVWNKSNGANGSFYRAKHEFIFIFKSGEAKHKSHLELVDRIRYNVWEYPSATSFSNPDRDLIKDHPTPKPVSMMADAMKDASDAGDIWLDFFLGSGSTLISAEASDRICYGTEIEPHYCHLIIRRWLKYCKKQGKEIDFEHLNGELHVKSFIETDGRRTEEENQTRNLD
ncbi:MAG: DNA methyltransferase [Saprospiraceae bacterium]